jgi:hypothetical protein
MNMIETERIQQKTITATTTSTAITTATTCVICD